MASIWLTGLDHLHAYVRELSVQVIRGLGRQESSGLFILPRHYIERCVVQHTIRVAQKGGLWHR